MVNRKAKIAVWVAGGIWVTVAVAVVGAILYMYVTNRTFEQTLATNLNVSREWIEISPEPSLQTRQRVSEIAIEIQDYSKDRLGPWEIKLPDGRVVAPQIQVVDANGTVHEVRHSGFSFGAGRDLIIFTPHGGFIDGEYKSVRIRSDEPFTIKRGFWRERNPK